MSGPNKVYATREEARLASQHQWAMGEVVRLEAENKRLCEELARIRAIAEGALWPSSEALAGDAE